MISLNISIQASCDPGYADVYPRVEQGCRGCRGTQTRSGP